MTPEDLYLQALELNQFAPVVAAIIESVGEGLSSVAGSGKTRG